MSKLNRSKVCFLLIIASTPLAAQLPDHSKISGVVSFDGEATLGDFTGTSTEIEGRLIGAATVDGVTGWVTFPTKSLTTGSGKRDRDMYKSLQADKYPVIRFDLLAVASGSSTADSIATTLRGRFTINGVAREEAVRGWLWLPDSASGPVRFKGQALMNLKDYQIGGLSKLFGTLKMHEDIVVNVDLKFSG